MNNTVWMASAGLTILLTSSAWAQAGDTPQTPLPVDQPASEQTIETPRGKFHFGVNTGLAYQAPASVDGGGRVSATRYSVGGGGVFHLNEKFALNFSLGYERHDMRFNNVTRMGDDPWENANILGGQVTLAYHINDQWTIHGGPLASFAAEDGASWSNAFTMGAAAGVEYRLNDKFRIGGGLGVIQRLEDHMTIFPIIQFVWRIDEQWTLRSGMFDLGVQGGAGIEAAWSPRRDLELAAGVQYQSRRFRLDDHDIAPDGVGQESSWPVYLKAAWYPKANLSVSGFMGVLLGGKLELDDEDGHNVTRKHFDPALVLGGRVGLRF